jgi:hypothetical protein
MQLIMVYDCWSVMINSTFGFACTKIALLPSRGIARLKKIFPFIIKINFLVAG